MANVNFVPFLATYSPICAWTAFSALAWPAVGVNFGLRLVGQALGRGRLWSVGFLSSAAFAGAPPRGRRTSGRAPRR